MVSRGLLLSKFGLKVAFAGMRLLRKAILETAICPCGEGLSLLKLTLSVSIRRAFWSQKNPAPDGAGRGF